MKFDCRNAVRPNQKQRGPGGNDAAVGAGISTHVCIQVSSQAQNSSLLRTRDLEIARDLARMIRGHEVLPTVLDPLHRTTEFLADVRKQKVFWIELAAHAE